MFVLVFFEGPECNRKWVNMRDAYNKGKVKKLGSGSAANTRKTLRDESMSFLEETKITNTRFGIYDILKYSKYNIKEVFVIAVRHLISIHQFVWILKTMIWKLFQKYHLQNIGKRHPMENGHSSMISEKTCKKAKKKNLN